MVPGTSSRGAIVTDSVKGAEPAPLSNMQPCARHHSIAENSIYNSLFPFSAQTDDLLDHLPSKG